MIWQVEASSSVHDFSGLFEVLLGQLGCFSTALVIGTSLPNMYPTRSPDLTKCDVASVRVPDDNTIAGKQHLHVPSKHVEPWPAPEPLNNTYVPGPESSAYSPDSCFTAICRLALDISLTALPLRQKNLSPCAGCARLAVAGLLLQECLLLGLDCFAAQWQMLMLCRRCMSFTAGGSAMLT